MVASDLESQTSSNQVVMMSDADGAQMVASVPSNDLAYVVRMKCRTENHRACFTQWRFVSDPLTIQWGCLTRLRSPLL
jgi:hypothetical protein